MEFCLEHIFLHPKAKNVILRSVFQRTTGKNPMPKFKTSACVVGVPPCSCLCVCVSVWACALAEKLTAWCIYDLHRRRGSLRRWLPVFGLYAGGNNDDYLQWSGRLARTSTFYFICNHQEKFRSLYLRVTDVQELRSERDDLRVGEDESELR